MHPAIKQDEPAGWQTGVIINKKTNNENHNNEIHKHNNNDNNINSNINTYKLNRDNHNNNNMTILPPDIPELTCDHAGGTRRLAGRSMGR